MPPPPASFERRLILLISAVVFVDTMFYAVIAPLLPTLVGELHLSKASAGLMTASYALGTLVGALPGGILAARAGPRPTVIAGLSLLAVSTVAFAALHSAPALDCARFVQGVSGACSWAGGIAWIAAEASPQRRGALIGRVLAAAVAGALFGPVIGTLATALGRGAAFGSVVVLVALLIAGCRRLPSAHVSARQGLGHVRAALATRGTALGVWLVTLPALATGVIGVLAPLSLHELGASAAAIGATFVLAAASEVAVTPAAGRISDRRGRLLPLTLGLLVTAGLLLCFSIPDTAIVLAALVVSIDAALGAVWTPAMALLSDAAEAQALDQGLAAALMNIAWAAGQVVGAGAGGAVANAAGDAVPTAFVAGLFLVTLAAIGRVRLAPAT